VKVTHSHVVAHQIFALRLISWLECVLGHSEGFRALFSRILVEQEVGPTGRKQSSILEGKSIHTDTAAFALFDFPHRTTNAVISCVVVQYRTWYLWKMFKYRTFLN
jgi:hypothetical protein